MTMRKTVYILASLALCLGFGSQVAQAQELTDAQKVAAEAAKTITDAPEAKPEVEQPKYWDESLKTNIKFGQTSLNNWAAGGDNTVTLQAFIDGNANYKKNDLFWNNRLQLDYGFVYASSKPILQKSDDRIYFESKFGYKNAKMRNFSFSANYDFKSQFSTGSRMLRDLMISSIRIRCSFGKMPARPNPVSLLLHIRTLRLVLTSSRGNGSRSTLLLLQEVW